MEGYRQELQESITSVLSLPRPILLRLRTSRCRRSRIFLGSTRCSRFPLFGDGGGHRSRSPSTGCSPCNFIIDFCVEGSLPSSSLRKEIVALVLPDIRRSLRRGENIVAIRQRCVASGVHESEFVVVEQKTCDVVSLCTVSELFVPNDNILNLSKMMSDWSGGDRYVNTYIFLDASKSHNSLVDGAFRDKAIDGDLASLT